MDFEQIVLKKLDTLDKKLDKVQDDVTVLKVENVKQTACININTTDLALHKEGVIQNRARIKLLEDKAKPLTVKQLFTRTVWFVGGVGTIAGAIFTVLTLLKI
jgi:hypothetical protein